ncbi:MAG: T9SS type A sorting domain-containing protein [Flavobacteriales bacterium]|nr:T9SS type A sorting domain-containing protein [Flavobacteriales bacterium]
MIANTMRTIRTLTLLVSGLLASGILAQGGGCSITLLSDSSTVRQFWCLDPPVATIEPVVFLVEGTGVQVTGLPQGVTAVLSNDTLTVSGTITTEGLHAPEVTTSEGCVYTYWLMDMSLVVDPEFSCSVVGEDVILHWPGMNAPLEWGDDMIILCTTDEGFFDVLTLFLPAPDSAVWSGLPTNTELHFGMTGNGAPYCFPGYFETSCTIITTGVNEHAQGDMQVRAVPHGEWLELSAPVALSEVRVYDMVGGLIAARKVNAFSASLPIASLATGVYLLHVVGADGRVSVQRFVKQ